jgi:hypothetical protein
MGVTPELVSTAICVVVNGTIASGGISDSSSAGGGVMASASLRED